MTPPIGVLGATGYTGQLVIAELARRGRQYRLGARNPDRVTTSQGAEEVARVDVTDRASLLEFLAGVGVVINTAGPFAANGLDVIDAAVHSGVGYVDCSGELAFLRAVFERYSDAPVPIVVACGFQAVPGDCGASAASEALEDEPSSIHVHYSARMLPSRGTARTLIGELGDLSDPCVHDVPGHSGRRRGMAMPLAEKVTVARAHPDASLVTTVRLPAPRLLSRALPTMMRAARRPLSSLIELLPAGPPPGLRRRDRADVLVVASGASGSATVRVQLRDTYGLTARFLVEAAGRVQGSGAMTPSQALGGAAFLDAVSGDDESGSLSWSRALGGAR